MKNVIKQLTTNLKPKRPLLAPELRFALWILATILIIAAAINYFQVRPDITTKLFDFRYIIELLIMGSILISGALSAFYLSIPGETPTRSRHLFKLMIPLQIAVVMSWFFVNIIQNHHFHFDYGYMCGIIVGISAVIPSLLIIVSLLRGAAVHKKAALITASSSGAISGLMAIQLICPQSGAGHLFVWHFIPFLGLSALLFLLGSVLYKLKG